MASFADLERWFERLVDRSNATLFRAHLQAVQLDRRVERAMERARIQDGSRTMVPYRYRVRLTGTDLMDLAPAPGDSDALAARLADNALAFARAHGYQLRARPVVLLATDGTVRRGEVEVDVEPVPAAPVPPAASLPSAPPSLVLASAGLTGTPVGQAAGVTMSADATPAAGALGQGSQSSVRGDGTHTMVFRRPAPPAARAMLRVCGPRGGERTIEVDGTPLDIGRAVDNRLVLDDARVSRRHGRLQARHGALVYTDLGSTNGSRVNGIRVDEIALGMGDRLQLGDTVLVVEALPG